MKQFFQKTTSGLPHFFNKTLYSAIFETTNVVFLVPDGFPELNAQKEFVVQEKAMRAKSKRRLENFGMNIFSFLTLVLTLQVVFAPVIYRSNIILINNLFMY